MLKKVVVAYFKVYLRNLRRGTQEDLERRQSE
jgi:hypothetical protein